MSLVTAIQKYVPLGRRPTLPRGETLALKPIRNRAVAWERPKGEDAAGLHLRVPRRQDRFGTLLGRWLAYPTHKTIELDEFGAAIWERCDGTHRVEQLVAHTSQAYKMNRRQAEVSVIAFLKMLAQRRLIGFAEAPPAPSPKDRQKEQTHGNPRPKRQHRPDRAAWRRH
jgi:hypothetical protein